VDSTASAELTGSSSRFPLQC